MSFLDRFRRHIQPNYLPEAEQTEAVADEVYVVAGDKQEYKAYLRTRRQYRTNQTYYVSGLDQIRRVRKALIIFTGSWTARNDGIDLWESAQSGGNKVIEDLVL